MWRRDPWKFSIDIKSVFMDVELDEDGYASDEDSIAVGKEIANRLKENEDIKKHGFGDKFDMLAMHFEEVSSQDDVNDCLELLYDLCDDLRVWVK